MSNKTEGVKLLVKDVLITFSEPYGEDIILEVCQAIEKNADWHRRYQELSDELSDGVVNQWISKYTKDLTKMKDLRVVATKKSKLITAYTKLN